MTTSGQEALSKRASLASVRRVSDERAYLYELIQTIGSGPDLDSILRGVVRLVTEATSCHACFIYFLREDQLELKAASHAYAHLEGDVRIPIGEGLTGWVAKTRRSGFIKEGALDDPRVRRAYFPELGDEVYQSLVSVPVFARDGDVIGVITLHAEAPHEFGRSDLDLLEHTASLLTGAIDNARLYDEATARVDHLTDLSRLLQRIASAANREEVLAQVTAGTRASLTAARCEIYLVDGDGHLQLASADPARSAPSSVDVRSLWLGTVDDVPSRAQDRGALVRALWEDRPAGNPVLASLVAGEERLGIIVVLLEDPVPDADTILSAIASHAAVALKQHDVIERLRERNLLKDFFQALSRPDASADIAMELARRLGCDLAAPHILLHIEPPVAPRPARRAASSRATTPTQWPAVADRIEARLSSLSVGLLVDRLERSIRALVPLGAGSWEEMVTAIRSSFTEDPEDPSVSVGVSGACSGAPAFARGFDEASAAAEVGALIRGGPGVTTYDDLGPYRYVLSSEEGIRDRYRESLERLVAYDDRRGTQLLDTLESYLDHRGNVVGTSRALFIHPNTLRQRLSRIERVSGVDLEHDDWLSLAVATKVVKLRRMRTSARERGKDD